jgi:hypothetical protein
MVPVLSAFYFGTVEHYRFLAQHPKAIVDIGEHYERQSYRTRTSIVGPNGAQDLTVQIARRSGEKMPMHTVGLSYIETWPQQHVHAIRSAYGNTPWFIHYIDEIEAVIMRKYDSLVDLDLATMRLALKWLGLKTEVVVSEKYVVPSLLSDVLSGPATKLGRLSHETSDNKQLTDLRTSFHPKKALPPELTSTPPYTQIFADRHGFVPRMSVIDLVMNTGPEARTMLHLNGRSH